MAAPQRPDLSAAQSSQPAWPVLARLPMAGNPPAQPPLPSFEPPPPAPLEPVEPPPPAQQPASSSRRRVDPPISPVAQATARLAADCATVDGIFTEALAARDELPERDYLDERTPSSKATPTTAASNLPDRQQVAGLAARAFVLHSALGQYASLIVTAALIFSAGLLYWLMLGPGTASPTGPELPPPDWSGVEAPATAGPPRTDSSADDLAAARPAQFPRPAISVNDGGATVSPSMPPPGSQAAESSTPESSPASVTPLPPTSPSPFPSTGHAPYEVTRARSGDSAVNAADPRFARRPESQSVETLPATR